MFGSSTNTLGAMVYPKPGFVTCISYTKSPPPMTAVAVAVIPIATLLSSLRFGGAAIETVGVDKYPEPITSVVMEETSPLEILAVAAAFCVVFSAEIIAPYSSSLLYLNNSALST